MAILSQLIAALQGGGSVPRSAVHKIVIGRAMCTGRLIEAADSSGSLSPTCQSWCRPPAPTQPRAAQTQPRRSPAAAKSATRKKWRCNSKPHSEGCQCQPSPAQDRAHEFSVKRTSMRDAGRRKVHDSVSSHYRILRCFIIMNRVS